MGMVGRIAAAALIGLAVAHGQLVGSSGAPARAEEASHPADHAPAAAPARAEETSHAAAHGAMGAPTHDELGHSARAPGSEPAHGCLNQKERRALIESGTVLRLSAAVHAIRGRSAGSLVRARLCRRGEAYVYMLTVLGHDGKVARLTVDAAKGTLVGGR